MALCSDGKTCIVLLLQKHASSSSRSSSYSALGRFPLYLVLFCSSIRMVLCISSDCSSLVFGCLIIFSLLIASRLLFLHHIARDTCFGVKVTSRRKRVECRSFRSRSSSICVEYTSP